MNNALRSENAVENTTNYPKYTARLKREVVQKHGAGKLKITKVAWNVFLYMSPHVDLDGRINISKQRVKTSLHLQKLQLDKAITRLIENNLLEEREGRLYSLAHSSCGETSHYEFVENYSKWVKGGAMKLSPRTNQLLAHLISAKMPGKDYVVNFENLYQNTLHTNNAGINYFFEPAEVISSIMALLKEEYITVKLGLNNKAHVLTGCNIAVETAILEHYIGKSAKEKAERSKTSNLKRDKHVLIFRLTSKFISNKEIVNSSKEELNSILMKNGSYIGSLQRITVSRLIKLKNELYKTVGEVGLAVYRESLEDYFSEKSFYIEYHDSKDYKLFNFIKDHYLLNHIQNTLLEIAEQIKVCDYIKPTTQFNTSFGVISHVQLMELLSFYYEHSSKNHLVLFEGALHEAGITLDDLKESTPRWNKPFFVVHTDLFIRLGASSANQLSQTEMRNLLKKAAEKKLLTQQKEYERYVGHYIKLNCSDKAEDASDSIQESSSERKDYSPWFAEYIIGN